MKTRQMISALLASLLLGTGMAQAQSVSDDLVNGVKLRGDGSVDDTQPGASGGAMPANTLAGKLAKLEEQRSKREAQRDRALAALATDDPRRIEVAARYEEKLVRMDAKQARIEARAGDDNGTPGTGVRREDRRADRRDDRPVAAIARGERVGRAERPQRAERPEKVERAERGERVERPERIERVERAERVERPERPERIERPERVERAERPERVERSGRG